MKNFMKQVWNYKASPRMAVLLAITSIFLALLTLPSVQGFVFNALGMR